MLVKKRSHRKVTRRFLYVQHAMVLCPGRDNDNLYQGRQSRVALELRGVEGGKKGKSCNVLSTYGRSDGDDVIRLGDWI